MFVMPDLPPQPAALEQAAASPAQAAPPADAASPAAPPLAPVAPPVIPGTPALPSAAPASPVPAAPEIGPVESAPAGKAQAAPAPTAAETKALLATRQEVQSHGYRYIVVGNTLLPRAAVEAAIGQGATPQQSIAALKKAYEAKGWFLVALVGQLRPDQEVWLQVVQGRLTHIEGPKKLTKFFTGLEGDSRVRNSDIIRQSTLAQSYAATNREQPAVSFKPAPEAGGSTMVVAANPLPGAHMLGGSLTAGNFGNRYAGHYLAQAQAYAQHDGWTLQVNQARALTGMDENTRGAFYSATSGTLTKVTPIGTFSVDDSATRYELGRKFAPLFPAGTIKRFGGTATQLLYADDSHRWSLNEGVHRIRDAGTVFKGAFTLRDQKYFVWELGTDYAMRVPGLFGLPASVSVSGGVKLGGARGKSGFEHGLGNPVGHFQVYTAGVDLAQALPKNWSVQLSLSGQTSPDILPSYQQWVLGGVNNLTAWLPGTLVGDRGWLGRATLQAPQWTLGKLIARPALFVEHGAARYSFITRGSPTWTSLADVGASVSVGLPVARTSLMLAYAKSLGGSDVPEATRRGQLAHVFFYLQVAL